MCNSIKSFFSSLLLAYFSCASGPQLWVHFNIEHCFIVSKSGGYKFPWRGLITEHLVAKKAVKSGSARSYISFKWKILLSYDRLWKTHPSFSVFKSAPKKILALRASKQIWETWPLSVLHHFLEGREDNLYCLCVLYLLFKCGLVWLLTA